MAYNALIKAGDVVNVYPYTGITNNTINVVKTKASLPYSTSQEHKCLCWKFTGKNTIHFLFFIIYFLPILFCC